LFEPKSTSSNKLLEAVSSVFHDAWVEWSKSLAEKEQLSAERLARWSILWVPYEELDGKMKEEDRKWARKVLETTSFVAQQHFEKWANNLEKRLKKRNQRDEKEKEKMGVRL